MYILRLLSFQVPTSYSADIINLKKKQTNREMFSPGWQMALHFLPEIEEQCSENR